MGKTVNNFKIKVFLAKFTFFKSKQSAFAFKIHCSNLEHPVFWK